MTSSSAIAERRSCRVSQFWPKVEWRYYRHYFDVGPNRLP